jgi:hypothetical protein
MRRTKSQVRVLAKDGSADLLLGVAMMIPLVALLAALAG